MSKRQPSEKPPKRAVAERPPSQRDCAIYEQHLLHGETQQQVAAAHAVSQQRVAQITARVEAWLATHPEHPLAQSLRLQCARRWETLWEEAMKAFARSRQNREIRKERTARRKTSPDVETMPVATVVEEIVREQNGDPRFLSIARRVVERQDRLWLGGEAPQEADGTNIRTRKRVPGVSHTAAAGRNATEGVPYRGHAAAGVDDLDKLARFMTGTPIRGVVFIETEALMRLVHESIAKRREFRLADLDQLLFGNKIIAE